ncbi:hypothetical protein ACVBIO_20780, partial [Shewanella sp. 0m-8]
MSWFKHHKTLELSGHQVKFDYHSLSGTLRVSCEGNRGCNRFCVTAVLVNMFHKSVFKLNN